MEPETLSPADYVPTPAVESEPSVAVAEPDASTATTEILPPKADDTELSEVELLRIENERLKLQVQALSAKEQDIKELADDAAAKEKLYESKKAEASDAKEEWQASLETLAARARGDVQIKLVFTDDDGSESCATPTEPSKPRGTPQTLNAGNEHMAVAGVYRSWQFALHEDELNKCDATAIVQLAPEADKRKVGSVKAMADHLYVPAFQRCYEDESGYFDCWPLLDREEWDARLAEEFGPAIGDLKDGQDHDKRKKGGEYCGLIVKVGRKKLVVGPDREAIRLVYGPGGRYAPDTCIAAQLLPEHMRNGAAPTEAIEKPKALADRVVECLREYPKLSTGMHEAYVFALASDLKVEGSDIDNAVLERPGVLDIYLDAQSKRVVRLLQSN